MFNLSTFCCICLHDGEELQSLNDTDFDNTPLLSKLKYCTLANDGLFIEDISIYICIQCCHILRLAYNFKKMCIKNNYYIKGYVSKMRSDLTDGHINVSLEKLKNFINNRPLTEYLKTESHKRTVYNRVNNKMKTKKPVEIEITPTPTTTTTTTTTTPEIEIHEPEINIQENENPIKIDSKETPLINNNDFQEKSSTQTLELLKILVHGTNSQAVDKLKQLVAEPIPENNLLNYEFDHQDNYSALNKFETIYVKPEPIDNFNFETEERISEVETEDNSQASDDVIKLLDRDDNFCPICKKTFLCKSYYERHITMHTGIKNHQCHMCKKRFTRKSTLKTHIFGHTGEIQYPCPVCKKIFNQKGNMKSHMATHFPGRNYECLECGKGFLLKQNLKIHSATHENGRKPSCPICRKRFLKHYLPIHIATHKELR